MVSSFGWTIQHTRAALCRRRPCPCILHLLSHGSGGRLPSGPFLQLPICQGWKPLPTSLQVSGALFTAGLRRFLTRGPFFGLPTVPMKIMLVTRCSGRDVAFPGPGLVTTCPWFLPPGPGARGHNLGGAGRHPLTRTSEGGAGAVVSRPPRPAPACICAALVSFPSFWRSRGSGSRGMWSGATRTRPLAGLLAREDFLPLLQPRMVTAHPTQSHARTGSWRRLAVLECSVLSQLFHSPLSPSSRGSLVLHFLP